MTASPYRSKDSEPVVSLSLVGPLPEEAEPSEDVVVRHFESTSYNSGAVARSIGPLTTYASLHYRDFLGGKSGIMLEIEHRNKRRALAVRIFQEFGMIDNALLPDDEVAMVLAAKEAAAKKAKISEREGPTATDVLTDAGRAFVKEYYDPAEAAVESKSRSEMFDVIDAYFDHPVIKTTNAWARTIGESNDNMLRDAVLLQRASALILERIGEPKPLDNL